MSIWLKDYKAEAALIGEILTRYGDLEYDWSQCLSVALGDRGAAFRCLFRLRGGAARIQVGDALMRPHYEKIGMKAAYEHTLGAFRHATMIRNQFAHANFYDSKTAGLYFTDMEKPAKTAIGEIFLAMNHIDEALLRKHVGYMDYTADWLGHLNTTARKKAGEEPKSVFPAPKVMDKPPLHNPTEEHPLPSEGSDDEQPPEELPAE